MAGLTRRRVLLGVGGAGAGLGLAGCLGAGLPGAAPPPDRTVYVGAYHWGFVLLDEAGTERESITVDPGTRIRMVAFNTEAHEAVEALPAAVRSAVPEHATLEERNEDRIPEPPAGDLHDALAAANERYPDHSVAVVPAGRNQMGGPMMDDGMMGGGVPLPHDAPRPAAVDLVARARGDQTLTCLVYCGYGHPFMELPGAFVVR